MSKRRISSGSSFEARAGYSRAVVDGGEHFARARLAATAVICGLVDERMRIEIEVTARKGD